MREVDVSEGDQLAEVSSRARARARALVLTFSMVAKSVMEAERDRATAAFPPPRRRRHAKSRDVDDYEVVATQTYKKKIARRSLKIC